MLAVTASAHRLVLWIAVLAAGLAAGCQHESVKRGRVHGTVTLDGAPLAKGQIRILAIADGGIGAGGEIVDGTYDIPADRGPTAGTYRVEIVSMRPTGRKVRDSDTNEPVDELFNTLPARYHSESTLKLTVNPASDTPHDFALKKK